MMLPIEEYRASAIDWLFRLMGLIFLFLMYFSVLLTSLLAYHGYATFATFFVATSTDMLPPSLGIDDICHAIYTYVYAIRLIYVSPTHAYGTRLYFVSATSTSLHFTLIVLLFASRLLSLYDKSRYAMQLFTATPHRKSLRKFPLMQIPK